MPARSVRSTRRAPVLAALVVSVGSLFAGCAPPGPGAATSGTPVTTVAAPTTSAAASLSATAPTTGGSTPVPTTVGATATTARSAATASVAPRPAVLRGLPTATTKVDLIDPSRPTVSGGRTIAPTRTLATLVAYPTSGGPYPLVVFAHGYQLGPGNYRRIINVIASAGYVVAAPSFPLADAAVAGGNLDRGDIANQSDDLSFVIDQVTSGELAERIDATRIGAVGHSDGADTVLDLGYTAAHLDTRVRAVAALAPDAMASGSSTGSAPLLIVHGDRDSIVPYRNATTVFGQVRASRFLVTLTGADHLPPVQGAAPWAAVVDSTVLDLLDHHVASRTATDDALMADAAVPGVANVKRAA